MNCIRCGAWTQVLSTRKEGDYGVKRARRCANDCPIFQTHEVIDPVFARVKWHLADAHATVERRAAVYLRNRRILVALDAGRAPLDIASELGLSNSTVSLVKRARDKLLLKRNRQV